MSKDYRNGEGLFAYDLNAIKGAVKNRFPGMNQGDFDASYAIAHSSVNQRIQDYKLKNNGQRPTQEQVITWATEDITTESYSPGGFGDGSIDLPPGGGTGGALSVGGMNRRSFTVWALILPAGWDAVDRKSVV